jgi:hypothetical protein
MARRGPAHFPADARKTGPGAERSGSAGEFEEGS